VSMLPHIAVVATALIVTWAVTPVVRTLAARSGVVAKPGGRNIHQGAIPRLGGVAMFVGCTVAIALRWVGETWWEWSHVLTKSDQPLVGLFLALTTMFIVGLIDDIVDLRPIVKFAGQLVAAGIAYSAGIRLDFVGDPFGGGLILLGVLSLPVTLFWMAGFTNVINLIDGMDGLAAGVTAIAAVSLLVLAEQSSQGLSAVLAAALVGACVGFLRFNFNPASIFMGDSGSLFLGFMLSCISLLGVMKSVAAITLVVPLLIIGVPMFDTVSAIIRRKRGGRPIQEADKGHIHHRLLGRGFNQRQTVLIIYIWSIALAVGGYAMRWVPFGYKVTTFVVLAALSGLMAHWLGLFEVAHHHEDEGDGES